jgi:hypothetical protein
MIVDGLVYFDWDLPTSATLYDIPVIGSWRRRLERHPQKVVRPQLEEKNDRSCFLQGNIIFQLMIS